MKKTISVILAVLLTMLLPAACSTEKTDTDTTAQTEITTAATETETAENDTTVTEAPSGETPVTDAPSTENVPETTVTEAAPTVDTPYYAVTFSTTDVKGNKATMEMFGGAKLVLLNFWEPWCGPCVGEMPDLQKLYDNYKDKGLLVVGVYYTEDGALEIVNDKNISYPAILGTDSLMKFTTEYVPTTWLLDNHGNALHDEAFIGSKSYAEWESIVLQYLG